MKKYLVLLVLIFVIVKPLHACSIVDIIPAADDDIEAMAWDNWGLWVYHGGFAGPNNKKIVKIDTAGKVLKIIPSPQRSNTIGGGITSDGKNLWYVVQYATHDADAKLFKLTKNGKILKSFPFHEYSSGLAWDGKNLWVSNRNSKIYKINQTTGKIMQTINTPGWQNGDEPRALAFDGIYLWVATDEGIYKIDKGSGAILAACVDDWNLTYLTGLTWGAGHLWATDDDSINIMKIDVND